uniref:Uncharacterized protein n=1 Tax=Salix viminalis TaxID=40686 RepID=A0A6N2JYS4_SALVM
MENDESRHKEKNPVVSSGTTRNLGKPQKQNQHVRMRRGVTPSIVKELKLDATGAARSASDIVLTEPGLSVIISAVLTSRAIFQRMKSYTIYVVSITIRILLGFLLVALIWKFDFSAFMVLIIAILNDGTIMTISKDRPKPSPVPDSSKLKEIFATGVVLLACS